jgi:hypothetical protein
VGAQITILLFYITGIAQHVGPAIISLGGEGDEGCFYTDEGVICLNRYT